MMTIAHRLNTIMGCDKVMVLSFGMLAEFDTPRNLMRDENSEFNKFLRELQKKTN
jgi:ABC-type multidrug transport system fused ATPase/permease subunit